MKKAMKKKRKKEKDVNLINKNKCMFLVCAPHIDFYHDEDIFLYTIINYYYHRILLGSGLYISQMCGAKSTADRVYEVIVLVL